VLLGLTRAREKLYLSFARTRYRSGLLELSEPSRFLRGAAVGRAGIAIPTPLDPAAARRWARRVAVRPVGIARRR